MSALSNMVGRWAPQGGCLWILGGGLVGLLMLVAALALLPWIFGAAEAPGPSPALTVIPYPSATPTPTVTPTQPAAEQMTPTPSPPPAAGDLGQGVLVEIQGTEGDGLRLRQSPGLEGRILLVALENEVFEIQDGPVNSDGYTWWFLVNPYDNSQQGWGVSNYLRRAEGN